MVKLEEIVIIVLAGAGLWYAHKKGMLDNLFKGKTPTPSPSDGDGDGDGANLPGSAPPTSTTPPSTTTPANCTSTIYPKATGTWTPKYNGGKPVSYASGGSSTTHRWDADGVTSPALEATYYVTWPASGSGKGDHLELKFWGPGHSDGACCWCLFNCDGSGRTGIGHEGPHPSTTNFGKEGKNVGSIKGKTVGIKAVIWPISSGAHLEGYMDVTNSGKWEKVVSYDGACGKSKKSTKPVSSQQIQFRVDSIKPIMKCATINAIRPPTASSAFTYTHTYAYPRITIA